MLSLLDNICTFGARFTYHELIHDPQHCQTRHMKDIGELSDRRTQVVALYRREKLSHCQQGYSMPV